MPQSLCREDTRFSFVDTDLGGLVGADDDEIYAGQEEGGTEGGGGAAKKGAALALDAGQLFGCWVVGCRCAPAVKSLRSCRAYRGCEVGMRPAVFGLGSLR